MCTSWQFLLQARGTSKHLGRVCSICVFCIGWKALAELVKNTSLQTLSLANTGISAVGTEARRHYGTVCELCVETLPVLDASSPSSVSSPRDFPVRVTRHRNNHAVGPAVCAKSCCRRGPSPVHVPCLKSCSCLGSVLFVRLASLRVTKT